MFTEHTWVADAAVTFQAPRNLSLRTCAVVMLSWLLFTQRGAAYSLRERQNRNGPADGP